jgi:ABC-type uncharacterized transport system substrate-binding protein
MRRRELFALAAGAAAAGRAWAQAPAKQYRIAIASPAFSAAGWRKLPLFQPFFPELRRLGDVEGQNLTVEYFTAAGQIERFAELARQIVGRKPDVIVSAPGDMTSTLMSATRTIPIVAAMADPVFLRLVTNLAHPGGNLTGVSTWAGVEVEGKRLELLKEAVPSASRLAVLSLRAEPLSQLWRPKWREYAAKLRLSLIEVLLNDATPQEIARGFAELARRPPDAMMLGPDTALIGQARLIIRLAQENRLPAMYPYAAYSEVGGLMTYTFDPAELGRQLADDVHRILHGAKPGDIPFYQPTRFKLTINLKAAQAIGLAFPPDILERADAVIQ